MVTEDYVSHDIAKLLKEKEFNADVNCTHVYVHGRVVSKDYFRDINELEEYVQAPTLQTTMKWLREVHNIAISIYVFNRDLPIKENGICYTCDIATTKISSKEGHLRLTGTYEQVCEAAIKYCLENLIKNEDEEEESGIPVPKTVDEAISTLEKILSDEDRDYLLENGAISMHDSLGRWIRNEWGLWTGSELKDELMNMNKGLNHPDDMSNYIIEEFIKYWNNKL